MGDPASHREGGKRFFVRNLFPPRSRRTPSPLITSSSSSEMAIPTANSVESTTADVDLNAQFNECPALYVLQDPSADVPSREYNVDIIAIHGLGGHARKTWTADDGCFWLLDLLPKAVPTARIMTYGYDSRVVLSNSVGTLNHIAVDLLNRLKNKRLKQEIPKPVIFICHSMGGIVLKQTLVSAHERLSLYGPILSDIRAVIFFGTPHQGSDLASRLEVLGRVLECVGIGSNAILTALTRDGLYLTNLAKSFVDRSSNLRIISFFEQLKVRGVNNVVVNEQSASLNVTNEEVIPINSNHMEMCKFRQDEVHRWETVNMGIVELVSIVAPIRTESSSDLDPKMEEGQLRNLSQASHAALGVINHTFWRSAMKKTHSQQKRFHFDSKMLPPKTSYTDFPQELHDELQRYIGILNDGFEDVKVILGTASNTGTEILQEKLSSLEDNCSKFHGLVQVILNTTAPKTTKAMAPMQSYNPDAGAIVSSIHDMQSAYLRLHEVLVKSEGFPCGCHRYYLSLDSKDCCHVVPHLYLITSNDDAPHENTSETGIDSSAREVNAIRFVTVQEQETKQVTESTQVMSQLGTKTPAYKIENLCSSLSRPLKAGYMGYLSHESDYPQYIFSSSLQWSERYPNIEKQSLSDVYQYQSFQLEVSTRIRIAFILALSLLQHEASHWMKKKFCSSDFELLCSASQHPSEPQWIPHIVVKYDSVDHQPPQQYYLKNFENRVYSLGVVLLELGLSESLLDTSTRNENKERGAISSLVWENKLVTILGKKYQEIVGVCINWDPEDHLKEVKAQVKFYEKVVRLLDEMQQTLLR